MMRNKLLLSLGIGFIGALAVAIHMRSTRSVRTAQVGIASAQVRLKSPVSPAGLPQPKEVEVGPKAAPDWSKEYERTSNYFEFVSKAAKAALDGDSKAARYISKSLYICLSIQKQYAHSSDPQSDFDAFWAARTHAPQWAVDRARKDFHDCIGFINGDAFAGLPAKQGGYNSIRYWIDKSAEDPVSQALQAGAAVAATTHAASSESKAKSLDAAQQSINSAVASKDPEALFQVGRLLSDGQASDNPLQGFALSIAACNMGYDCSANNAELFHGCASQGTCQPGISYADIIKNAVGDDAYAQAYARAQQIQDAMARDDMAALHAFVQLKR